jgi:hypothetical protein
MSEHDTQSHLVQYIIASFLFFGPNTLSDLLETELVALPGRRAWVGEGGSLPMGHLKQLEYGGKKLGSKIVQRQQSLEFWSRCYKRIVCNNIAAEGMRARARHWRRRRRPPDKCETKQGNSTHRRLCSSSHSMLENTRRSPFRPRWGFVFTMSWALFRGFGKDNSGKFQNVIGLFKWAACGKGN